jgi:hypothetical protein
MAVLKPIYASQSQITSENKKAGQLIFTYDSRRLYFDLDDNTRIQISDIIELNTELERTSLLVPVDKFYFIFETGVLWRYHLGAWSIIAGKDPEGFNYIVSDDQPDDDDVGIGDIWAEVI